MINDSHISRIVPTLVALHFAFCDVVLAAGLDINDVTGGGKGMKVRGFATEENHARTRAT